MKIVTTVTKRRVPQEGDRFWFWGGRNRTYIESTFGRFIKCVKEYQAYELRPIGCHYHKDGCHPKSPDHKIVKRVETYVEVFEGGDSRHKELNLRYQHMEWDPDKDMWFIGHLS